MENLKSVEFESVNGVIRINGKLMEHSLFLMTPDRKTGYNVLAKCRNTDLRSIVKCLIKAQLASMQAMYNENTNKETMKTNHKVTNAFSRPMQCTSIYVTDKKGNLIDNSLVTCGDRKNLKEAFGVKGTDKLTKLVVHQGLAWDNEEVVDHMHCLVNTIIRQLSYGETVDKALAVAAAHTDKEQTAEEKAAKEKEAAKVKAAKEKEAAKVKEAA